MLNFFNQGILRGLNDHDGAQNFKACYEKASQENEGQVLSKASSFAYNSFNLKNYKIRKISFQLEEVLHILNKPT